MEAVARSLDVDPSQPPDFAALYASEFNFVWHLVRRMGVASRNQPDVVQDVFLTVHRRLGTYDSSRPLRPWVAGVALRVALDHLRLARNTRELVGKEVEPVDLAPAADERLRDEQARWMVQQALLALDPDRRALLILHDIDEQPVAEIAEAIGIPVKTVYSRLRAARLRFEAALHRLRLRRGEP